MDSIFNGDDAAADHVAIANQFHETDAMLGHGYRRAADLLVEIWTQERDDNLLPPIVLLYRHSLELHLTSAIATAERAKQAAGLPHDTPHELATWFKQTVRHNLDELAGRLDGSLEDLEEGEIGPHVRAVIAELHGVDPGGENFRYSWSTVKQNRAHRVVSADRPAGSDGRVNIVGLGGTLGDAVRDVSSIDDHVDEVVIPARHAEAARETCASDQSVWPS